MAMSSRQRHWSIAILGVGLLSLRPSFVLAEDAATMTPDADGVGTMTTTSTVQYTVPPVTLVRNDGKAVELPGEMNDGRPVVLNFIFTSCGSICPLMSQTFAQFERKLGAESGKVHLMSISTDPEADTPARLTEYANKFHAGPEWQHYTGTQAASLTAQKAFDVYRGDKMSHTPVTLLRAAPDKPWLRIDGFVTPDELLRRYRQLLAAE
jgi:protein SCO1/2